MQSAKPLFSLTQFDELLSAIYGGVDEQPTWDSLLGLLRETLSAGLAILILRQPSPDDTGLFLSSGLPDDLAKDSNSPYASGLFTLDPFVNLPPGTVVTLEEYITRDTLVDSEFYRQCMQPFNILHILGCDFQLARGITACLRLTRSARQKPFRERERAQLAMLLPHLQRALGWYLNSRRVLSERGLYDDTLARLALGVIMLDEKRQIVYRNAAAEQLLSHRDGLLVIENQLHAAQGSQEQQLRELIDDALQARRKQSPHLVRALAVTRKSAPAPLNLVVRPLPIQEMAAATSTPAVAVFLSDPTHKAVASAQVLGELYGLSPAESRLVLALSDGQSLEQACNMLGISRNTGRAHLRAIFAKTGVSQQTMLVSLILKSTAALTAI